jgi:hypothetical protein
MLKMKSYFSFQRSNIIVYAQPICMCTTRKNIHSALQPPIAGNSSIADSTATFFSCNSFLTFMRTNALIHVIFCNQREHSAVDLSSCRKYNFDCRIRYWPALPKRLQCRRDCRKLQFRIDLMTPHPSNNPLFYSSPQSYQ